jgi:amidohydrolase
MTKATAASTVAADAQRLAGLSEQLHAHPEVAWEEHRASRWVAEALAEAGFDVTPAYLGLETAFHASYGSGPFRVGLCAEYDALPGLGHACGHNLIAAIAVGAARALAPLADTAGLTIDVYGTPAEEGGGGKIVLLRQGAFAGAHAAMMVHPSPYEMVEMPAIAVTQFQVAYTGKEAHASAYPHLGVNAADALVVAQTAIGLLRQHLRPTDRVHGIVTRGGDAPNVVPAHTTGTWMVRAATIEQLAEVRAKVARCFEAGALATGTSVQLAEDHEPYAEMHQDQDLAAVYRRNAEALGRRFAERPDRGAGSTDMGNVSLALPSIHPTIGIDALPAVNHQPEFTAKCVTPAADQAVTDGAVAMAWTAIDAATDGPLRSRLLAGPASAG